MSSNQNTHSGGRGSNQTSPALNQMGVHNGNNSDRMIPSPNIVSGSTGTPIAPGRGNSGADNTNETPSASLQSHWKQDNPSEDADADADADTPLIGNIINESSISRHSRPTRAAKPGPLSTIIVENALHAVSLFDENNSDTGKNAEGEGDNDDEQTITTAIDSIGREAVDFDLNAFFNDINDKEQATGDDKEYLLGLSKETDDLLSGDDNEALMLDAGAPVTRKPPFAMIFSVSEKIQSRNEDSDSDSDSSYRAVSVHLIPVLVDDEDLLSSETKRKAFPPTDDDVVIKADDGSEIARIAVLGSPGMRMSLSVNNKSKLLRGCGDEDDEGFETVCHPANKKEFLLHWSFVRQEHVLQSDWEFDDDSGIQDCHKFRETSLDQKPLKKLLQNLYVTATGTRAPVANLGKISKAFGNKSVRQLSAKLCSPDTMVYPQEFAEAARQGNKQFIIIDGLRLDMAQEGTESAFNGPTILSISKDSATLLRMLEDFKLNSEREIELPRTDVVWKHHKEKEHTLITLPPSPEDQRPCITEIEMKATRDYGNGSTATFTENVIIQQNDLQKPVVFGRRKEALFQYLFDDINIFCGVEVILYPAKERAQLVLPAHKTFKGKGILIFCEKDERYHLCRDGVIIEIPFVNHFRFAVLRSRILVNVDLHMKWNIPDGPFPPAPGGGELPEANLSTNVVLETGDTL